VIEMQGFFAWLRRWRDRFLSSAESRDEREVEALKDTDAPPPYGGGRSGP
jgi:hypothetical protein